MNDDHPMARSLHSPLLGRTIAVYPTKGETMLASKISRVARCALGLIGAVGFASFAPSADAADYAREHDMPSSFAAMQRMKPADIMQMLDTNKDRYVTQEEFLEFQKAFFQKIDKDRDRRVTMTEFTDQG